jgi:hypothetical protein
MMAMQLLRGKTASSSSSSSAAASAAGSVGGDSGDTNHMERFAETFVQYMLNPTQLKAGAPTLYQWVDDFLLDAISNAKALGL